MTTNIDWKHRITTIVVHILVSAGSFAEAEIIDSVSEDVAQARGREARRSKGGPGNNKLTNTNEPVRAGRSAFKH